MFWPAEWIAAGVALATTTVGAIIALLLGSYGVQAPYLVFLLSVAFAFADPPTHQSWNGLFAPWDARPNSGYDALPRQLSEKGNFVLKDNQCTSAGAKFRGQRYWVFNDPATIIIFDKNGIIAGWQTSVRKSEFTPAPTQKGFVDDDHFWTQTIYFVDPSTICSTGRTKADLDKDGTGTGLWLQYGPDITKDVLHPPLLESEVKKNKLWGSGRCLPTMGMHYWYNVTEGMKCDDFLGNCLLYNHGKLTGFCIAKNVHLESIRYDFPPPVPAALKATIDPVPKCFFSEPAYQKLSSIHVYFHENPRNTSTC